MALIKIDNLNFSYYSSLEPVFKNVSFQFDTNWKIGLIGRNGIGKSTLFKLLLNEEEYKGKIISNVNFALFPPKITDKNKLCIDIYKELTNNDEEWKLYRELNQLELDDSILYTPFSILSKGEQTKLLLAILFCDDNGFLLIDEPTNHLDLIGREKIAKYLKSKSGFMLISHDRNFLDNTIDHVISINKTSIDVQNGNFTSWNENRILKEQFETRQNEKLKKEITRLKETSEEKKSWALISENKSNDASLRTRAKKMMKKHKNIERRVNATIEDKSKLLKDIEEKNSLSLNSIAHHKKTIISVNNLSLSYGDKKIINDLSFDIEQGEQVAIVGKNGSGKTSLINVLLGNNTNYEGTVNMPNDLKISYISQDTSYLVGSLNDFIKNREIDETLFKTILRKLNFSRSLFNTDMRYYSDGQKKKVLIASSLSTSANIFIWDEPLNYIDIISRDELKDLIKISKPTLLFIEHDKAFIYEVATKIIKF